MNDKDDSGAVSVEEVMGILYLRYGRQLLDSVGAADARAFLPLLTCRCRRVEMPHKGGCVAASSLFHIVCLTETHSLCHPAQQLEDIFGTSDTNTGRELSLTEFLHSLNLSQVKQMRSKAS